MAYTSYLTDHNYDGNTATVLARKAVGDTKSNMEETTATPSSSDFLTSISRCRIRQVCPHDFYVFGRNLTGKQTRQSSTATTDRFDIQNPSKVQQHDSV